MLSAFAMFQPMRGEDSDDELGMSPRAVGARLRHAREAKGLSQAALCRLTGIETNAWNNYERGIRLISPEQARKVCIALKWSMDWIYLGNSDGLPEDVKAGLRRKAGRR